ncbi:MAG: GNAT family N-acetyltransferase [Gammaproteobacteria bacterium]|nr:GNAT family N-acetyltransferase [Gammaproteobacteria bacterium]NIV49672.1 GNAT family N-acetyltransferase [Gammaproteobacteria bacterium]NIW57070.1 GNAT family N-acetyltransferase [Gammaproteobacteria bacterium]
MAGNARSRPATAADLPAVEALLAAEGLPTGGVGEILTHFRVMEDGHRVIAAAGIEPHGVSALLRSVVVAPEHRGRGLARRLSEDMLRHARELGCEALYLLTLDAEGYFAELGFTRIERDQAPDAIRTCRQYREQCPDTAVLMRLAL